MCHPAVYYVAMAASAAMSAKASYDQGQQAKKVGEYNARLAENQATEERSRATEAMSEERTKAMQLRATQRAAAAARGVEIDYGTALHIQEDTEMIGRINAQRIDRYGDQRQEALTSEALMARSAGSNAARQGSMAAAGTLIGAAGSMAGAASGVGSAGGGGTVAPQRYSVSSSSGGDGSPVAPQWSSNKYSLRYEYGKIGNN